ncbi:hypothetical protein Taro_000402 [Colocasia esculenta]|uniref:Uncharacterized protein n=1 Tax=Colocasia esculenta TaxID=4460 RepID=A0A843THJ5_COLES|nr:hypothetical protein [Colocasia esculenta]
MATPHSRFQTLHGCVALVLFLSALVLPAAPGAAPTIHDLLKDHGLPAGVLPRTVQSFSLDPETGVLEARLEAPCYARWRDNPVYFDKVVSGNLSYGALRGVNGLAQEELFLWLPVKGILVADPASGVLLLDIGLARKQLSLSVFDDPPDCRPAAKVEGLQLLQKKHGSRVEGKLQAQR